MSATGTGLLLCDDLIFTSRVTGTAQALGLRVQAARSADALVELARRAPPACVIVDLHNPGLDLGALLARLAEACPAMPRVVAYGSHVEAATLHAARQAGCEVVLPRSKFVEELPEALPGRLGGAPEGRCPPVPFVAVGATGPVRAGRAAKLASEAACRYGVHVRVIPALRLRLAGRGARPSGHGRDAP